MPVELVEQPLESARPVHLVAKDGLDVAGLGDDARAWAEANEFSGESGRVLLVPGEGGIAAALLGTGTASDNPLDAGRLARDLPAGDWYIAGDARDADLLSLGVMLGGYAFSRYRRPVGRALRIGAPSACDVEATMRRAEAVALVRDLVNTPANDLGPDGLEAAARAFAAEAGATIDVVSGDALLARNFPMIHAVGRASDQAPRLIDIGWGSPDHPRVTLVGKGVCFDTGGLDIKPSSSMLLMKKDMGGAASVLGLARLIVGARLKVRLRVLIPAVENSIGPGAFRPGDILTSRKGITVEIGNTDAEGRLVLADALALADEEEPALLVDMATLTGAARVALGPELVPFYTDDDGLAAGLAESAAAVRDPLWRMPLWQPYDARLFSRAADMNNVSTDGFAGSVVAALFLKRFVEKAGAWAHFDIYAWNPLDRPHCPVGGEAQAIRALEHRLALRYPA